MKYNTIVILLLIMTTFFKTFKTGTAATLVTRTGLNRYITIFDGTINLWKYVSLMNDSCHC